MSIISRTCPTGPVKLRECLAFFGVEYHTYLWIALISLIVGFSSYYIYLKIRKVEFESKKYIAKSLLISVIVFLVLSILSIWFQSQIIY